MAKTQAATALVASQTIAAGAATPVRATLDCSNVDGGIVTFRITNSATAGMTAQCLARILVAHKGGTIPTAASEGTANADWKQVYEIGGGTTASASTRSSYRFGPEIAYLEIEFTSPSTQSAVIEAHATTYAY